MNTMKNTIITILAIAAFGLSSCQKNRCCLECTTSDNTGLTQPTTVRGACGKCKDIKESAEAGSSTVTSGGFTQITVCEAVPE